jgi:predicted phage terminase large subunit-like protein
LIIDKQNGKISIFLFSKMVSQASINEAKKRWSLHFNDIQRLSTVNTSESKAEQLARIARARKDYAFFVEYYFPHWCTNEIGKIIPSAKFHIQAAKQIIGNRNLRAVYKWARGHAKSTHMNVMIPLWLKCQTEKTINVMVLVGKSEDNACTLLGDIQFELENNNRYIHDFGKQMKEGSWADGNFVTRDETAFFARGRGQSPRGLRYRNHRPDYIVIDDLDDDELCQNEARVRKMTDWLWEALYNSMGAEGGRFVMVGNLISKNSVLAHVSANEMMQVSQVNIYDKNGKPAWPEYWTPEHIKKYIEPIGYRSFQKEYMNNPITEGAVFKNDWVRYKKLPPLKDYQHIIAYCDPSFKSSVKNDYKAIKVWGKIGTELHNIKNFVRQCSTAEMVRWFYDLHESLPEGVICNYFIEANFLQDIILDEFTTEGNLRGYQLPIRGDHRQKPDKFQRIESISPLWERGFVWYNEDLKNDRDTLTGIEQLLAFEKGTRTHDDAPDADEGAIYLLQKRTRIEAFTPRIGMRTNSKHGW